MQKLINYIEQSTRIYQRISKLKMKDSSHLSSCKRQIQICWSSDRGYTGIWVVSHSVRYIGHITCWTWPGPGCRWSYPVWTIASPSGGGVRAKPVRKTVGPKTPEIWVKSRWLPLSANRFSRGSSGVRSWSCPEASCYPTPSASGPISSTGIISSSGPWSMDKSHEQENQTEFHHVVRFKEWGARGKNS